MDERCIAFLVAGIILLITHYIIMRVDTWFYISGIKMHTVKIGGKLPFHYTFYYFITPMTKQAFIYATYVFMMSSSLLELSFDFSVIMYLVTFYLLVNSYNDAYAKRVFTKFHMPYDDLHDYLVKEGYVK